MKVLIRLIEWIFLLSSIGLCYGQDEVPRPTFPDEFQVEVQGVFFDENTEVDGTLFYDRKNNRAAVTYTYQNESVTLIQKLSDNKQISVQGLDCEVTDLPDNKDENFFPFTEKGGKKILADAEELFYFKDSKLDSQEIITFPALIYTVKIPIPKYNQEDCDVTHIFSKPEIQLPDCEGHSCRSTLMSINVKCRNPEGTQVVDHTYNFFRFRSRIQDPRVFQVPVGVYCDVPRTNTFPAMPEYFSFAYDNAFQQQGISDKVTYVIHKKIWFDSTLKMVRIDEYDDDGLLMSTRVFDFYGGEAYTIVASIPSCMSGAITEEMSLDQMSLLPKIIFGPALDAVYVGKRDVHNLDFEVWSMFSIDEETDARVVHEFFFSNITKAEDKKPELQLSHIEIFTYERSGESDLYELSLKTVLMAYNYRTKPKEWEAFDVSVCYDHEQRLSLRLQVEGPPIMKSSLPFEEILERMYMRLIITTNISVIRISELTGVFDGLNIKEFTAWILDKSKDAGTEVRQHEPNMKDAMTLIQKASDEGKLNLKFKRDDKIIQYVVKMTNKEPDTTPSPTVVPKKSFSDCYSGGSLAAASICLLLLGLLVGVSGYYVFLKKRRARSDDKVSLRTL